jgi:hypothetical protein
MCKHLPAKPALSARAICLTRPPVSVQICCTLIYACTRKASRPILRHTHALKIIPIYSHGIHLVMQIRITLIPLITYTPPNDLATHNNAKLQILKHVY